jgi:hypothetical protein
MVSDVFPNGKLREEVHARAVKLAGFPLHSVMASKQVTPATDSSTMRRRCQCHMRLNSLLVACSSCARQLVRRQTREALRKANRDEAAVLQQMLLDPRTHQAVMQQMQLMAAKHKAKL